MWFHVRVINVPQFTVQDLLVLLVRRAPQVELVPLVLQVHQADVENVKLVVQVSSHRYILQDAQMNTECRLFIAANSNGQAIIHTEP